ncbi:MAG: phosphate ABC transporter substrate-binding protein PstS [Gomphosphaeria aponina SAG 52.96 = DSM 107014]|uniref:Phosphate-binding protein n=1 Tax=Gomphosphaeria aponina SAG 52.96 = DSM 107014 TaxID=1521640 RepID=A0A941GPR6_9CHRO|nr:phosphate ABC transporter substrate-binding protein PstS [Gomphosphaeria aponina SAG 52.96 = DSM 107014]
MLNFKSWNKGQMLLAPLLIFTLGIGSCGNNPQSNTEGGGAPQASGSRVSITGAGATFPAPLYQRWFFEYNRDVNPNVQISYQSVGSGAGIEQFTQGTVDFGASDIAMSDEQIAKVSRGVVLLPMAAGSIVFAYNLPDVPELKLSRKNYVDIMLGNITKWNDPALAADNPGVNLPDQNITVVVRSDGSGTTSVFTQHLGEISSEWKEKVGSGTAVEFPVGIASRGNEGVTATLSQTQGSIGYIEYGFARKLGISMATIENQAGNFVSPNSETTSAALAAVELPENLRAFIFDPEGENSYPIVTYTWILAYKTGTDPAKRDAFKGVMLWALDNGQTIADDLGYIPLPPEVITRIKDAMETIE